MCRVWALFWGGAFLALALGFAEPLTKKSRIFGTLYIIEAIETDKQQVSERFLKATQRYIDMQYIVGTSFLKGQCFGTREYLRVRKIGTILAALSCYARKGS